MFIYIIGILNRQVNCRKIPLKNPNCLQDNILKDKHDNKNINFSNYN